LKVLQSGFGFAHLERLALNAGMPVVLLNTTFLGRDAEEVQASKVWQELHAVEQRTWGQVA
jgi:hypothetical protein